MMLTRPRRWSFGVLAASLVLFAPGAAVSDDTANNPHLSGAFTWTVYANGLEPGHQYQAVWYFRGEDGREYWLGSNAPPVRRSGWLDLPSFSLDTLDGHASFPNRYPDDPRGYYTLTLSELGWQNYGIPALDPEGRPLVFTQEFE